jgi:hypothetical protein
MQRSGINRAAGILRFGFAALLVTAGTMVTVLAASSQQEVDPTWYDSRPAANNAVQHPSSPAPRVKLRHGKSGFAKQEHSSNKAHEKRQSNSNRSLATASMK